MHTFDLSIPTSGEYGLVTRLWCGETSPRYILAVVHGLGEHAQRYTHVAESFVNHGASVLAWDQKGHGRTGGALPHFQVLLDDLGSVETYVASKYPGVPLVFYGQSLGGGLVINYLLSRSSQATGGIATSPLLRTTVPPPAWKLAVAKALGKLWPSFTLSTAIRPKELTHDPAGVKAYQSDPLVHQRVSAALGLSMLEAGEWSIANAHKLATPLLLMHGTQDRITSCEASEAFSKASNTYCDFRAWNGLYHDMHWEPQREQVISAMQDFIDRTIASASHRSTPRG